jgi:hypothetical protein
MAGRGKTIDRANALSCQLLKKLAKTRTFPANDRDIAIADFREI